MPRRTIGPKSRTQKPSEKATQQRVASFLGDGSASDATNPNESNDESFGNPELEGDYTDYHLEYTLSPRSSRRSNQNPMPTREQIQQSTNSTPKRRSNQEPTSTRKQSEPSTSKRNTRNLHASEESREEENQANSNKLKSNTRKEFLPQQKKRKQKTPQRREMLMWKQIQKLQQRTDNLTPKVPFGRLIRELLMAHSTEATRITAVALETLQISAELYITQLFSDAYVCTLHRGRVTLGVHDIRLVRFLRGVSDPGSI